MRLEHCIVYSVWDSIRPIYKSDGWLLDLGLQRYAKLRASSFRYTRRNAHIGTRVVASNA